MSHPEKKMEKSAEDEIGEVQWFTPDTSSLAAKFLTGVLKAGPVPRHLSCIMDGNRTYSKAVGIDPLTGYVRGFHTMVNLMNWCILYGVKELSGYVFSIDNFKRDATVVKRMFDLFKKVVFNLYEHIDEFNERGVSIRFIGDWSRVSPRLKPLMAKVMLETKQNDRFRLNFAFVYTSRNEITRGVQELWRGVNDERLTVADLSVPLLDEVIRINSAKYPVDLLVRTSGCTRLSDFMLWQTTEAILHFVDVLWPDYNFWEFQKSIFFYQRQQILMEKFRLPKAAKHLDRDSAPSNVRELLEDVEGEYWTMIQKSASKFQKQMYIDEIPSY